MGKPFGIIKRIGVGIKFFLPALISNNDAVIKEEKYMIILNFNCVFYLLPLIANMPEKLSAAFFAKGPGNAITGNAAIES